MGYEIEPFSILDLYPMMCDLLGIEPRPNNGSMEIVKMMYKEEQSPPKAGQQSVVTWSTSSLVAFMTIVVVLISL